MKKILYTTFLLLATVSCNSWFDAAPEGDGMGGANVFGNESAFRDYMNGIYTGLRSDELYGHNLTLGGIEFLSQCFIPYANAAAWCKLDTSDAFTKKIANEAYTKLYAAIYQCNDIIRRFEENKDVNFVEGSRKMMVAEAKALRAFLHFELLRLYSPALAVSGSASNILWVDNTNQAGTKMTTTELTDKVISELSDAATELQTCDPVVTGEDYDDNSLLGTSPADRRWKLNYYAVQAVKARALMTKNRPEDYGEAYTCLMTIINSGTYHFSETISGTDYSFSTESIFALPSGDKGICATSKVLFGTGGLGVTFSTQVTKDDLSYDDRRRNWFDANNTLYTKFAATSTITNWKTVPAIPIVKIGEVWLMAAESALKSNQLNAGVSRYNLFMERRNSRDKVLPANANAAALQTAIDNQYRYEFLGEGVRFLYCKRLNYAMTAYDGAPIAAVGNFSLPIVQ